jgi:Mycothiol maleylpyruvate isomerase N-terminal domain
MSSTGTPSRSQRDEPVKKDNPMTVLNAEHARRAIVEHTRRLAESAAAAGLDAAVATTPGWTITDLVEHVGQTQHWLDNTADVSD